MKKYIRIMLAVVMAVLFIFTSGVFAEDVYPEPTNEFYVNDFANVLSSDTERKIVTAGRQIKDDTGVQIVLVTVDSLNGQDIKTYSIDLASKWQIGQKGKDDGILILNSVSDRKVRIEVGYGLEGTIGAVRANEIIDETITPYLKTGDYDNGLLNGYAEVVKRIADSNGIDANKYFQAQNGENEWTQGKTHKRGMGFTPIILIIFLIIDGIFFRFRFTSALIKIIFWSNIFRGGGGRGGWGGGGFGGGGFGGGSGGSSGGSSGGGGTFGGGGSDGSY